MALDKLPVLGRPTIWITVGQGPTALAVGAGGGLDIFTLLYPFSPLSPSLWETTRYRLKYCLKGSLNPKQPTNQPTKENRRSCMLDKSVIQLKPITCEFRGLVLAVCKHLRVFPHLVLQWGTTFDTFCLLPFFSSAVIMEKSSSDWMSSVSFDTSLLSYLYFCQKEMIGTSSICVKKTHDFHNFFPKKCMAVTIFSQRIACQSLLKNFKDSDDSPLVLQCLS